MATVEVQLEAHCQVGSLKISQLKILAVVDLIVLKNLNEPKVVKKLLENRPKSFYGFKTILILRMTISG